MNEFEAVRTGARAIQPKDAATLIILRRDAAAPRVLMGKRHAGHAFMPNKYVFPGGRVDAADCRMAAGGELHPKVVEKLLKRMRGKPSAARARGLAMAAIRETFEEVGLIVGRRQESRLRTRSPAWRAFLDTGFAPDPSGLRFFARAITPPGRTRRFDTRFFALEASHVANPDAPIRTATDELLDPYWVTFEEARALDLPSITLDILSRLSKAIGLPDGLDPGADLPFQHSLRGSWRLETL